MAPPKKPFFTKKAAAKPVPNNFGAKKPWGAKKPPCAKNKFAAMVYFSQKRGK